jgi:hypothetical protein
MMARAASVCSSRTVRINVASSAGDMVRRAAAIREA